MSTALSGGAKFGVRTPDAGLMWCALGSMPTISSFCSRQGSHVRRHKVCRWCSMSSLGEKVQNVVRTPRKRAWSPETISIEYSRKIPALVMHQLHRENLLHACIRPDLPLVARFSDIANLVFPQLEAGRKNSTQHQVEQSWPNIFSVSTVAAQIRSSAAISRKVSSLRQSSDALLIVSGSSLVRKLVPNGIRRIIGMSDSVQILSSANSENSQEEDPGKNAVELWAVVNPNVSAQQLGHEIQRAEEKVRAGATCLISQPCLDAAASRQFWSAVKKSELLAQCGFICGLGLFPSERSARFWMMLTDVDHSSSKSGSELLKRISESKSLDASGDLSVRSEWERNLDQIEEQIESANLRGIHIMPVSSWRRVAPLLRASFGSPSSFDKA